MNKSFLASSIISEVQSPESKSLRITKSIIFLNNELSLDSEQGGGLQIMALG